MAITQEEFNTLMAQWLADNGGLYNSAHTGADIDAAISAVPGKQDALTGAEGQMLGFDADGKPVAQDPPPATFPAGGTSGQFYGKNTDADYDGGWFNLPAGSMVEMTQEEYDALSDDAKMDGTVRLIKDAQGGGGGVHFSTEEREIGTWMGKPLYQITKTVTGRTKVEGYYTAEHGIANVETIFVNPFGTYRLSTGGNSGMTPYLAWNNEVASGFISGVRYANATVINFVEGKDDTSAHTWYVTLCYTKTTDTAA